MNFIGFLSCGVAVRDSHATGRQTGLGSSTPYFTATGTTGAPVPPVTGSGVAENRNV